MKYRKAIARIPCREMVNGLTTAELGPPDYEKALRQHGAYIDALQACGLEVIILDADSEFPDSVFIEDTASLTPQCAIICNPGAPSRRGEILKIGETISKYYDKVEYIKPPGTLEAGDIMPAGSQYYIGLSDRTNDEGANQLIEILDRYGLTGSIIPVEKSLHLKSGVAYLENNNLLASKEFADMNEFQKFNIIRVEDDEAYAANCVWINGTVLIAEGFPKIKSKIESYGYKTLEIDVSEFRKLDGGLSCLSLRF